METLLALAIAMLGALAIRRFLLPRIQDEGGEKQNPFDEGWEARLACQDSSAIPAPPGGVARKEWKKGWRAACQHLEQPVDEVTEDDPTDEALAVEEPVVEEPAIQTPTVLDIGFKSPGRVIIRAVREDGAVEVTPDTTG